jgi:hypothetical protein
MKNWNRTFGSNVHYVFFDGTSNWVGTLEDYENDKDLEIVFHSYDFEECCDLTDELNEAAGA